LQLWATPLHYIGWFRKSLSVNFLTPERHWKELPGAERKGFNAILNGIFREMPSQAQAYNYKQFKHLNKFFLKIFVFLKKPCYYG